MGSTISIPREEYEVLKTKSDLFDHFVEVEGLDKKELTQIKKALKGPFLSKAEFLKRHKELA